MAVDSLDTIMIAINHMERDIGLVGETEGGTIEKRLDLLRQDSVSSSPYVEMDLPISNNGQFTLEFEPLLMGASYFVNGTIQIIDNDSSNGYIITSVRGDVTVSGKTCTIGAGTTDYDGKTVDVTYFPIKPRFYNLSSYESRIFAMEVSEVDNEPDLVLKDLNVANRSYSLYPTASGGVSFKEVPYDSSHLSLGVILGPSGTSDGIQVVVKNGIISEI